MLSDGNDEAKYCSFCKLNMMRTLLDANTQPDLATASRALSFHALCPRPDCDWDGTVGTYSTHVLECAWYRCNGCLLASRRCTFVGTRTEVKAHMETCGLSAQQAARAVEDARERRADGRRIEAQYRNGIFRADPPSPPQQQPPPQQPALQPVIDLVNDDSSDGEGGNGGRAGARSARRGGARESDCGGRGSTLAAASAAAGAASGAEAEHDDGDDLIDIARAADAEEEAALLSDSTLGSLRHCEPFSLPGSTGNGRPKGTDWYEDRSGAIVMFDDDDDDDDDGGGKVAAVTPPGPGSDGGVGLSTPARGGSRSSRLNLNLSHSPLTDPSPDRGHEHQRQRTVPPPAPVITFLSTSQHARDGWGLLCLAVDTQGTPSLGAHNGSIGLTPQEVAIHMEFMDQLLYRFAGQNSRSIISEIRQLDPNMSIKKLFRRAGMKVKYKADTSPAVKSGSLNNNIRLRITCLCKLLVRSRRISAEDARSRSELLFECNTSKMDDPPRQHDCHANGCPCAREMHGKLSELLITLRRKSRTRPPVVHVADSAPDMVSIGRTQWTITFVVLGLRQEAERLKGGGHQNKARNLYNCATSFNNGDNCNLSSAQLVEALNRPSNDNQIKYAPAGGPVFNILKRIVHGLSQRLI